MDKVLYTIIYFLLAVRLFFSFSVMANRTLEGDAVGGIPILEIFLVCVCTLFCVFTYRKGKMPYNARWMTAFLLYVLLISLFHGFIGGFHRKTAVFTYAQPLLFLYVEYYAQQNGNVRKLTPVLVKSLAAWITILFFWYYRIVIAYTMESLYTTNSSYYMLYLMPMFFLFLKEKYRNLAFIIMLIMIVMSAKRGGMFALVLGFLAYSYTSRISNRKGFIRFLLLVGVLIDAFILMDNYMGGLVVERYEETFDDEGHGRLGIWALVWTMIQDSDWQHSLFGHGFGSVTIDNGIGFSAHNDYLEIIYDFGWVGLVLFVVALVAWIVYALRLIKLKSNLAPILMMAILILITQCTFSHIVIYIQNFNLFTLFFGALSGMEKRHILTCSR